MRKRRKMPPETLDALWGSIRKWEAIVAGTGVDRGYENCPLCALFLDKRPEPCEGCPVSARAEEACCADTPYVNWGRHHRKKHGTPYEPFSPVPGCRTCTRLAKAELKFLVSLLPTPPKKPKTTTPPDR